MFIYVIICIYICISLIDTGQLVIYDGSRNIIWKSHSIIPTHTPTTVPTVNNLYCPPGYKLYDRYCLLFADYPVTWYIANDICNKSSNGWLVSVTNDKLTKVLNTYIPYPYLFYWTGGVLVDRSRETWLWIHGEPWYYTNWMYRNPDYQNMLTTGKYIECISLMVNRPDFNSYNNAVWDDLYCTTNFRYICQNGE